MRWRELLRGFGGGSIHRFPPAPFLFLLLALQPGLQFLGGTLPFEAGLLVHADARFDVG